MPAMYLLYFFASFASLFSSSCSGVVAATCITTRANRMTKHFDIMMALSKKSNRKTYWV